MMNLKSVPIWFDYIIAGWRAQYPVKIILKYFLILTISMPEYP
jgi:hypothetical protein